MGNVAVVAGTKENILEDIHSISRSWGDDLEQIIAAGKDTQSIIIEHSSALFVSPKSILILVDPEKDVLGELKRQIEVLKGRIHLLVYLTGDPAGIHALVGGELITPEREREKRLEETVRGFIRKHGKKMTHEAFTLLTGRIRDEAILESELMKVINFVGDRKDIKSKDVLAVVSETHEENLFALFDALAAMDKKAMLSVLENLFLDGVHILAIHGYLVKQIRLLLQAKDMEEFFEGTSDFRVFSKAFSRWKEGLELKPLDRRQYLAYQKPYYAFSLSKTGRKLSRQRLVSFLRMLAFLDGYIKSGTKHDRVRLECGLLKA